MYGQPGIVRPDFLKKADEDFITKASSGFGGDRKAASDAWAAQADGYMAKGDYDYAMRRYNQAWLLNPDSYKPYWGFGRAMLARGSFEEALPNFEKARLLINDQFQKPALVADTGIAYHNKANNLKNDPQEQSRYFGLANKCFEESTTLDQTYATGWTQWAFSLYFQGRYDEAWEKVKKAQALDPRVVPAEFLKDLGQKKPAPRG
jgi:tetratricopeptide (TPR) repeat protein